MPVSQLYDGARNVVVHAVNTAGTVETDLTLLDTTLLNPVPTELVLWKARFNVGGGSVSIEWDAATDSPLIFLGAGGPGELDYSRYGGLPNLAVNPTGILLLTTLGFAANSGYMITLEFKKHGFFGWNYGGP